MLEAMEATLRARLRTRLERLYGPRAEASLERLAARIEVRAARLAAAGGAPRSGSRWDERDVVLISYGDQVRDDRGSPLSALGRFLHDHRLAGTIRGLHLLPFFPYSSDDGFSVIDYRAVDPALGSWEDIARLADDFELMFDLVLNHVSRASDWFAAYRAGTPPYDHFFIEVDPAADLSAVTRPRSSPLLSEVETSRGPRHVWATFSADQIDLNYAEPDVLVEMLDVLLEYVERGARIVRLDAIAYLWKELGTSCIHLPQTHEVVKLMRDLFDGVAPDVLLLTETNVPHAENVSYLGDGDEAHLVYQFSLAPLLLDALLTADAMPLKTWLAGLAAPPAGTTYFNFTASHDGVGVRPLEGLVAADRLQRLVDGVRARGGRANTRRNADGSDSPYELNITWFDAVGAAHDSDAPQGLSPEEHARRFLATQGVMLALQGIPGIYFHSLVGTPNDQVGVEATGAARSINRRKFHRDELEAMLADADSPQARILAGYQRMLAARIAQPAFHPDAPQQFIATDEPALVTFLRTPPPCAATGAPQPILVAVNLGPAPLPFDPSPHLGNAPLHNLLADKPDATLAAPLTLQPYQVAWLQPEGVR